MPEAAVSALSHWAISLLEVVLFRSLPFVGYSLASRSVRWWVKLAVLAPLAAGLTLDTPLRAVMRGVLLMGGACLGYFLLVGIGAFALIRHGGGRLGAGATFALLWSACILVPGSLPVDGRGALVFLGWEVMLSAYSLCREHDRDHSRLQLGDCLFFLLVNPTLVYPESGTVELTNGRVRRGWRRVGLGLLAWTGQDALRWAAPQLIGIGALTSWDLANAPTLLAAYSLTFVVYYLGHSGLASFRIGLMGIAGYAVPECYQAPFLATSPQDFWRRWNVWVGTWARRYLFFPLSMWLGRKARSLPRQLSIGIAVVGTFLVMGLLHDGARYAALPVAEWAAPKGIILFGNCGLLVVLWAGVAARMAPPHARLPPARVSYGPALALAAALALLHVHYLIYAATLWLVS